MCCMCLLYCISYVGGRSRGGGSIYVGEAGREMCAHACVIGV